MLNYLHHLFNSLYMFDFLVKSSEQRQVYSISFLKYFVLGFCLSELLKPKKKKVKFRNYKSSA